jgi:8-oxo-dGTP diphosphatase
MKHYVVGFMIWYGEVILIKKNHPQWQDGLLNGVGGHIEDGEQPADAMAREFAEETGVRTAPDEWTKFARMWGTESKGSIHDWECHCFWLASPQIDECKTMTSEEVKKLNIGSLVGDELIDNILFLIAMINSQQRSGFIYDIEYQGNAPEPVER